MTPSLSATTERGAWCPPTRARMELEAKDAQTSEDLARRLGLRSYREAHPEETPAPRVCECGCGVEVPPTMRSAFATQQCWKKIQARKDRMAHRPPPIPPGTRFGSRVVIRECEERTPTLCVQYEVRCDCGRTGIVDGPALRARKRDRCIRCVLAERHGQPRRAG